MITINSSVNIPRSIACLSKFFPLLLVGFVIRDLDIPSAHTNPVIITKKRVLNKPKKVKSRKNRKGSNNKKELIMAPFLKPYITGTVWIINILSPL